MKVKTRQGWRDRPQRSMLARFALLAAVVATLAVAGPVVKGSSRSLSADVRGRTKVVFFGDSGIYVANVDGTGLRRLTRRPDQDPVWSPDGSRIAFERCCYSVWAMKADGSSPRRLSRNGTDPAWSPDSSWIAFADLAAHLYVVRPDGRGLREVAHDAKAFGFAWSPDSTTLVYSDGDRFHLVDVRSGSRSTLPTAPAQGPWRPAWSPDGARIAFLSGDDNFLYVMPAAGGAARKLAKGEGVSGDTPAWSPHGSSILFMNNGDFRVIHPDGTGETQLSRTKDAGTPAWSPDGALISYQRERTRGLFEPGHDIWVARADGSGAAPVTRAFPDGIDYQGPQIANGTVAARPLARLALVSLPPSRRLISLHTVLGIAADGPRAAFNAGTEFDACLIGVWNRRTAAVRTVGDDCGDAQGIDQLALAGGRVAWTYTEYTLSIHTSELVTTTLRSRRQKDISADNDRNSYLGNLGGHGELLVFNRWKELRSGRVFRFQLWRITGAHAASARLIRSGRDAMKVATVDDRRVVIYTREGRIVILQAGGARLTDFRLGRGASEFFLSGSELALRRGRTIEIYDVMRGKRVGSRVLHPPFDRLRLAGLRKNIAVYLSGIAIHVLRLSDGRDVVLRLPNEAGPADAALGPQGLYYSYNRAYSTRPGRIGFIPIGRLFARLR